ncbi:outer membrane transport energization protein ExbB (TC 2.C.1.1.1) [Andreprevotia lacus DSM 23236]|jgi:biopolymer transport protein ExbB|uniref:Outer membrane transport energization protein ExbB (TC 2.C.1.1.1) n=1 Tax=Andreprevotia lacus DSM 23236 TaxID=1121001 RepID=A0A1W1XV81_9NEIS|nr:MotA/TolQ/ExbB proton channel family protein [Andreprevotia lacus]SMC27754.1 outer membrane transport energization protein ExbB (TC 2.C.1.1.1) [Andreprevotia lacus DSM 23236]
MNDITVWVVPGSLWLLGLFSVLTWSVILLKAWQHFKLGGSSKRFLQRFWHAADLPAAAQQDWPADGPLPRLARTGFGALGEADAPHDLAHSWDRQDALERHLRQQIHKERRALEGGLSLLASIGSTAPFVGLFGTVFGIMHALKGISAAGSASIDVVAGPIGEALVATGVGIAVAVPAVLAYNYFLRRLKLVGADLDEFATDFVNLAQRARFALPQRAEAA